MAAARSPSVDLLRGAVMVLMVLDHARDFLCDATVQPTNLATTTVPLFLTRWITHLCAPVFVLLAGLGAQRYGRHHGHGALTRYLITRGLWLALLDVTLVSALVPGPGLVILGVLWAIGWSMVALAALSWLPRPALLAVAVAIVTGHNLFDHVRAGSGDLLWPLLHQQMVSRVIPGHPLLVAYPVLPWIGVTALGHWLGGAFDRPARDRRRLLWRLGLGATAAFLVLRALDRYGDPAPWSVQARGPVFTTLSFLNCTKYPPSLLFLLMTLGPALCLLAALDGEGRARPLLVFGRTPLLFFLAHLALLRGATLVLALPPQPLWVAYLAWAVIPLVLYPLCRWFAAVKARRSDPWLSYL